MLPGFYRHGFLPSRALPFPANAISPTGCLQLRLAHSAQMTPVDVSREPAEAGIPAEP